jgi:hypothetical protein
MRRRLLIIGIALITLASFSWGLLSATQTAQAQSDSSVEDDLERGRQDALNNRKVFQSKNQSGSRVRRLVEAANDGQINRQNTHASQVLDTLDTITASILIDNPGTGLAENSLFGRSLVADLTSSIGNMAGTPPADTRSYVAYILNSSHIIEPAYAQGLGFSALSPVLGAWTTFRNLAYLCFVVIFLAIGFLIMFRQKVGGQTVVTAQQALPRMVISLVLVTFSYAIAGLLIDLMYLIMYLLITLFGYKTEVVGYNFIELGVVMIRGGFSGSTFTAVKTFVETGLGETAQTIDPLTQGIGIISGAIAMVVIAIAILIGLFRLFFELLKTYATIVISVVLAPISLMVGAIPGRNAFGPWLWNLIGNLAAFPAIVILLIIYDQITGAVSYSLRETSLLNPNNGFVYAQGLEAPTSGGFIPPFIGGSGGSGTMTFLLGLSLLLAMTDIVIHVKKAMGASDQFGWVVSATTSALKRGWTGDELVPGLAFTNTKNYGVSGKNIASKLWRGTEESQKRAEEGKFAVVPRGMVGHAERYLDPYVTAAAARARAWKNRDTHGGGSHGGGSHGGGGAHGTGGQGSSGPKPAGGRRGTAGGSGGTDQRFL